MRLRRTDCCPIGLDDIGLKAVTPCCQIAFEFTNLIRALEMRSCCPICKATLVPAQLLVQTELKVVPTPPVRVATKADVLEQHIKGILAQPDTKVLLFSEWSMDLPEQVLNRARIRFKEVKGSTAVIDTVLASFQTGTLRVLLLNAKHSAPGVNLHAATHVITLQRMQPDSYAHLVGRAQRPGRVGRAPLRVARIVYQDE